MEVSLRYPPVQGRLHTRYAPVRRSSARYCYRLLPLDLHVLSLPLAFILSQDQTLHCKNCSLYLLDSSSCPTLTSVCAVTHAISSSHPFQCSLVLRSKTGAKVPHFLIPTKYFFIFFAFFHNHRCKSAVCRRKKFSVQAKNGTQISAKHTSAAIFPAPRGRKKDAETDKTKISHCKSAVCANYRHRAVRNAFLRNTLVHSHITLRYQAVVQSLSSRCPVKH